MSARLVVDERNQLKEFEESLFPAQPLAVRIAAKVISYIFHPLFVPVYIAWFLVTIQPHLFASFTPFQKTIVIIRFAVFYTFFPLVTVLLAKGLGFLDSIYLRTQKERIIPYIACGIYYFFMWYVLRNQPEFSDEVVILAKAIWITSWFGLIANIYMKVSMHAMSVGVMVTFILLLAMGQPGSFSIYATIAILITGLVCTSRFIVSNHTPKEIYTGLAIGIVCQLIAYWTQ